MPTITAIKSQKNKKRFNIFLDGKFGFGVNEYFLLKHNLRVNKNLTQENIAEILSKEESAKLIDLATNFLSYRPRSEKEVFDYLIKKISQREKIKFSEAKNSPLIESTIKKLRKYKYLDDLEFAKWFVESRKSSPRGNRLIKLELKRKGITQEIIDTVQKDSSSDFALAKKAISKKLKLW